MDLNDLIVGQIYKRSALHDSFGGQRQGGICTPANYPILMLFTNESGSLYGYSDGPQGNGMFWYTGEGQVGDMQFVRGNKAIRDHLADGSSLHLFEGAEKTFVRYIGEAELVSYHKAIGPDINGYDRKVIVFELALRPAGTINSSPLVGDDGIKDLPRMNQKDLRKAALAGSSHAVTPKQQVVLTFRRSEAIKLYVKRRANGVCEACRQPAPFNTKKGEPYLEPHHTTRLADGGPDHPRHVGALCPNCHRRIHSGSDGKEINARLERFLASIEVD